LLLFGDKGLGKIGTHRPNRWVLNRSEIWHIKTIVPSCLSSSIVRLLYLLHTQRWTHVTLDAISYKYTQSQSL
jgi:hypothetical protein